MCKQKIQERIEDLTDYLWACEATENNPMPVKEIAAFLVMQEKSDSKPQTRKLIAMAIDKGHPIGSNNKGYFMLRTEKEMQKYLNNLMQRQIALSKRILGVYNAFHNRVC